MAGVKLAEIDFAAGLKTKHLKLPVMKATVELKDIPKDLQKAVDKDKLIIQHLIMAAYESLNASKKEIQGAILDFDANLAKKPPTSEKEVAEREKTINVLCKQMTEAHGAQAVKAVEKAWAKFTSKQKELSKFKLQFAIKMVQGTISTLAGAFSVAVNVAGAALTAGAATPVAIIGICTTVASMAKTIASMSVEIYTYARDIEKTEIEIRETDDTLADAYSDGKLNFSAGAREVAAILGVPFIKSVTGMGELLKEFHAKTAEIDKKSQKLYDNAKKLMTQIEKLEKEKLSKEGAALVKILGEKTTATLDKIHELQARASTKDAFYEDMRQHLQCYEKLRGEPLRKVGVTKNMSDPVIFIGTTLKTVVETSIKLVKLAGA